MSTRRTTTVMTDRRTPARPRPGGRRVDDPAPLPGVNVVGHLRAETVAGEAARTVVDAFRHAGHPVSCTSICASEREHDSPGSVTIAEAENVHEISLFCVDARETDAVYRALGPAYFAGRYSIGWWSWELDAFPASEPSLGFFDEIWTSSRFVQRAVSEAAPVPVLNLRLPVTPPIMPPPSTLNALDLPRDRRIVLFAFDALDVIERKNPLGVVRAFEMAFGRGSTEAHLVITAAHLDRFPHDQAALREAVTAAGGRLIETSLDRRSRDALLHACHLYVSLHRSEGFGATIAEAMAIGKPVVATAYSGNMDFMTVGNSAPVAYAMTRLARAVGPYPKGACWAEPDLLDAARHMARLVGDRDQAARLGQRAAADVASTHGLDAVSRLLSARVQAIAEVQRRAQVHDIESRR